MAEKFNEQKTKIKLAAINQGKPEFLMTEEELRGAVLGNLPKNTICPDHNCGMELFKGIGKTGEPYRAYKCGISGCKQILWTDREAETINAEVKDIEAMLGIEKPAATPAEGLEKKMKYWKDKDTSVQERIVYAQSWNLAVAMISEKEKIDNNENAGAQKLESSLKGWQKFFYQQLKNQNNGN